MKRSLVVVAVAAVILAMVGCGDSGGGGTSAPTSSSLPGASTSEAPATTTDVPTTAKPGTSATGPTLQVVQYAAAGEIPPGRTAPLDFPGWRASGSRWKPGDIDLVVRAAGETSTVLDVGARADASGSWEQTFVLAAQPGSYVAVASQGSLRTEAGFDLKPSGPVQADVDSGEIGGVTWTLTARRDAAGLVCGVVRLGADEKGTACAGPSEQDANGNDAFRYAGTGGPDGFLVGVGASGVEQVRVELGGGEVLERAAVPASFTGARFVAIPLPGSPVIRKIVAIGAGGQTIASFTINP